MAQRCAAPPPAALYRAADADALHEALQSLPMFPWLRITVEPLVTHPQEKALLEETGSPQRSAAGG